jgi:hypothetical protein
MDSGDKGMSQAFTQGFIIKDGARVIDSSTGALTVQGDVNIGANKLITTDLLIKQYDANYLVIKNAIDNATKGLILGTLQVGSGINAGTADGVTISASTDDNEYLKFQAKKNGVGLVEVARLAGAADPYFSTGGSQQWQFYNSGNVYAQSLLKFSMSIDAASTANEVHLGAYELAADRRSLAISTEEAVAVEAVGASDRTLSVRINGATYKIMLHT